MPVRNQNWYNLQSTRRYPLDDKSTGDDDSGRPIRDDIIVDCHIRYPEELGRYLFVQAINITPNLITILFGLGQSLTDTASPTVATITVDKPAEKNINYNITAFLPGISGWITFGPGIDNNFVGRYSTPMQTFIGARNARPYAQLPLQTIGKLGLLESLSGIVNLVAEAPVVATYYENYTLPKYDPTTEETNSLPVTAIVFSGAAATADFNPQTFFAAPCSQRPESGTCPKPPIERINGVEPDCETGNIDILFGPGLTGRPFEECGGLDITTARGLSEECGPENPNKKGTDECPCEDDDEISNYCWPTTQNTEAELPVENFSCAALPVNVPLGACKDTEFELILGSFAKEETDTSTARVATSTTGRGVLVSKNTTGLNISLFNAYAADWAYDKTTSVELKLLPGGLKQNGGVLVNYIRAVENGGLKTKYYAVMLDGVAQELQLFSFNGSLLVKENKISVPYAAGNWYKVSATASMNNGTTTISGFLDNVTTGEHIAALSTVVTDYEIVNGRAGFISNSAVTQFNMFSVTT